MIQQLTLVICLLFIPMVLCSQPGVRKEKSEQFYEGYIINNDSVKVAGKIKTNYPSDQYTISFKDTAGHVHTFTAQEILGYKKTVPITTGPLLPVKTLLCCWRE